MNITKIIFVILLTLLNSSYFVGAEKPQNVTREKYWTSIQHAYLSFLSKPSNENVNRLRTLLPYEKLHNELSYDALAETLDLMFNETNFPKFEKIVKKGKFDYIDLTFKIMKITDGHSAEMLCSLLGSCIKPFPKQFLKSLKGNWEFVSSGTLLESILFPTGDEYVDEFKKLEDELIARCKALELVKEESDVKQKCLAILRNQIEEMKRVNNNNN